MCSVLAQLKTEQEAWREFEVNRNPSWSSLGDWPVRHQCKPSRRHSRRLNNKLSLDACNLQVSADIKLLHPGHVLSPLHQHDSPSPTETCFSRAPQDTCHLAESGTVPAESHVPFAGALYSRPVCIPRDKSSYLIPAFKKNKKANSLYNHWKASHLEENKLSDCFGQFKCNWNDFVWSSGWICCGRWRAPALRMGFLWRHSNLPSIFFIP